MNIGIVTTWFERGAAVVSRAYRDVLAPYHNVYIYARAGEQYGQGDPNWDHNYVTWGRRVWGAERTCIHWSEFKRWALRSQIDLIIFNEQLHWPPVVLARRELPAVLGAYVDYYTSATVPFFHLYDFLLCNSRRHYSVFQHHPNALYVPWGTDCQLFTGASEPVMPGSLVFFHSAGRDPERKGTLVALKAFQQLQGNSRFVLHIQTPLSQYLEIGEVCRADHRIEVIEKTISAPGLYHLGDVYVYPTILEGIGLTIVEALACGLPVITTDAPPMNEFVRHGDNGRLVPPIHYRGRSDGYYWAEGYCSVEGVREAMQFYLDNRSRLREFKQRARAFAEENLDWAKNAADLPQKFGSLAYSLRRDEDLSALERQALLYSSVLPSHKRLFRALVRRLGLKQFKAIERLIYG